MTINYCIFVKKFLRMCDNYIYKNDEFCFYWHEGILMCDWFIEHLDYEFVDFGIRKRIEITGDKPIVMISDISSIKSSTREARQRMAQKDGAKDVIAVGIVIKSKVQAVIYKFFNAIYKQPAPAKIFTNKEDAIKWIKQYLPEQK